MSRLREVKLKCLSFIVPRFLSYNEEQFLSALRKIGVEIGDAIMVHSSFRPHNGFLGKPTDMNRVLMESVGNDGLLVMPSMTYTDSSKAFILRNKPMNVRLSPSHMGLLSEVFRRNRESIRSKSATHPLLAWGAKAAWFTEGHELLSLSFGPQSPFGKMRELKGKILCIDTEFESITFTHFVEDHVKEKIGLPLYERDTLTAEVIDIDGKLIKIPTRVISDEARKARCESQLISALERSREIRRMRIGNTHLLLVSCESMVRRAEEMYQRGDSFFNLDAR